MKRLMLIGVVFLCVGVGCVSEPMRQLAQMGQESIVKAKTIGGLTPEQEVCLWDAQRCFSGVSNGIGLPAFPVPYTTENVDRALEAAAGPPPVVGFLTDWLQGMGPWGTGAAGALTFLWGAYRVMQGRSRGQRTRKGYALGTEKLLEVIETVSGRKDRLEAEKTLTDIQEREGIADVVAADLKRTKNERGG